MKKTNDTAIGFISFANEFFLAATLVLNKSSDVSLPAYFLLGRSIELSLKAYLLAHGHTIAQIKKKKIGHDLNSLLTESAKFGLYEVVKMNDLEIGTIQLLNLDYSQKRFEYIDSGGLYLLPLIQVTEQLASRLISELKKMITEKQGQ